MSAFVFCLQRQGKPISRELFTPMVRAIDVYGIDGKKEIIQNNFAIGYQRFWTTPEEVGEKQPLYNKETHTWLIFDGRIDNRKEIYQLLKTRRYKLDSISDAQLFLELYKQTEQKYFKQVIGPFVFVLFNEKTNEVSAGRDAMGGRHLVYSINKQWLILATLETAVAAHKEIGFDIDPKRVVEHFAFIRPNQPSTSISGVMQLQPGFELRVTKNKVVNTNAYLLEAGRRICYSNPNDYVEAFREIFTSSVNDRLRSISPIASMTSGGLDSLPMSVIAAEALKQEKQQLHAISWVFDAYEESDERQYIEPVAKKYNLNSIYVNCDHAWPLKGGWHVNPVVPFTSPYRTFHNLAYEHCNKLGAKVALSGMGGDMLYIGSEVQIYELIKAGRLQEALCELQRRQQVSGSTMHCLKAHLLWPTAIYRKLRANIGNRKPDWLTNKAKQYLDNDKHWLHNDAQNALRPGQYWRLLDTFEGEDAACERFYCMQYGFEMRYPFRDKRLVEFMLQIPTEYLNFNNTARIIMREAMGNKLPVKVRKRVGKASFQQAFHQGMTEQDNVINQYLYKSGNDWLNYVKPDYINCNSNEYNLRLMLKWMCAYFQYWKENRYLQ